MKQHIILWRIIKEKTLGRKYSSEKNDFYDVLVNNEHVGRDVDTLRLRRSSVTWRRRRWRRYMNHHHHQPPSSLRTSPGKRAPSIQTIQAKKIAFSFPLFSLSKKKISVRDGRSAPWGLDPAEKQVAPPHWQGIQSVKPQGISRDASPSISSFCLHQKNWICPLRVVNNEAKQEKYTNFELYALFHLNLNSGS